MHLARNFATFVLKALDDFGAGKLKQIQYLVIMNLEIAGKIVYFYPSYC
jgi:hypothetical protein